MEENQTTPILLLMALFFLAIVLLLFTINVIVLEIVMEM